MASSCNLPDVVVERALLGKARIKRMLRQQMTLPKNIELQWQRETLERWLNSPGVPADAYEVLLQQLQEVKKEIENLVRGRVAQSKEWQS